MAVTTGLSGNEIYCLSKQNMVPGDLVIGNSVFSLGVIGAVGSGIKNLMGGEITQITSVIHEGRELALERMMSEAKQRGGVGITGVSSQIIQHGGNVEFLAVGSCLHRASGGEEHIGFSSSSNGQDLYCQIDAGFLPVKFAFGNVAYSIGVSGGILGSLKGLSRGEVPQYSSIFNETRHLALERIIEDSRLAGANAVLGIRTSITPFRGIQEMVMIGTASHNPALPSEHTHVPITSDLTNSEAWNLISAGYVPLRLCLGVSVYSLGLIGKITSGFKRLSRGEISELTTLIYEARENAIGHISREAAAMGADDVVGIKTYVYDLGSGLIEFMAIGTAIKRMPNVRTTTAQLPPQAIISDKDTFFNTAERSLAADVDQAPRSSRTRDLKKDKGPVTFWDVLKIILKIAGG